MSTLRRSAPLLLLLPLLLAACGDDEEPTPSQPSADAALPDASDPAEDASDPAEDVALPDAPPSEDAGPDVEPWWQDDVDYTLAPGAITWPAPGSIAAPSGAGSFHFGVATAATQIEDQNTAVDWHVWSLPEPEGLGVGTPLGDASRGFSRALDDIDLLTDLGVDAYRFSVEWARVEPQRDVIDEDALAHYDAFIDALVERGIRPVITLHHFSNPIWVDDPRDPGCADGPSDANLCGWDHPQGGALVLEEIEEHARLLGERFGDRVDIWCTVNEPMNYLVASYGVGVFPPGKRGLFDLDGILVPAFRNYIAAHAVMYDALKEADTLDADGDGQPASVGFTQAVARWAPARDNDRSNLPEDILAAARIEYFYHLLFVEALRQGGFDPDLDMNLDEPHPEWAGRLDWLGVQYYFRAGVSGRNGGIIPRLGVTPCAEGFDFGACLPPEDPTFWVEEMEYEFWAPGIYTVLADFAQRWPDLPMTVTESGIAARNGTRRAEHIVRSLEQIERARLDGADVRGYYHWSLYDNFEWAKGYIPRFGLYTVDFDATYDRTPTEGATLYRDILTERTLSQPMRDAHGGLGPMTPEE